MKNIKFRAWNKGNETYLYNVQDAYDTLNGFLKYDDKNAEYDECYFGDFLNNKRYDVEQFTGLTDLNGKDIYEGDIIVSKPNEPKFETLKIGVVKRSKIRAGWCYRTATDEHSIWTSSKYRTYEIIGNVHETPKLLEESK